MEDFKCVFANLKTEDLKEYIKLAQEELAVRHEREFTQVADKFVATMNELLETLLPGTVIFINDMIYIKPERGPLKYKIDAEDNRLGIYVP